MNQNSPMLQMIENPDLMQHLRNEFIQAVQEEDPASSILDGYDEGDPLGDIDEFIAFCRKRLADNQPIGIEYVEQGFAVRLQDSTIVPISTAGEAQQTTGGVTGGVAITSPKKAQRGIDSRNSRSWGITKPEK